MDVELYDAFHPYSAPFRIAGTVFDGVKTIRVELRSGPLRGHGEGLPSWRFGETVEAAVGDLERIRPSLRNGITRQELGVLLGPGAARNALDCALWDLEAKSSGKRAWELAGMPTLNAVTTAYSIGLDTPDSMAKAAERLADLPVIKVKIGEPEDDVARVAAVRKAAPRSTLLLDVNEGWTVSDYERIVPELGKYDVALIEQPFSRHDDLHLASVPRPIPVCADESCIDHRDVRRLAPLYDFINIKLDKAGGLTEALRMVEHARAVGLRTMVGCRAGTSLGVAPALIVAQHCEFADLDQPLFLVRDCENGLSFEQGSISNPDTRLWG